MHLEMLNVGMIDVAQLLPNQMQASRVRHSTATAQVHATQTRQPLLHRKAQDQKTLCCYIKNQITFYLSHTPNATDVVDLTVKCLQKNTATAQTQLLA
jgi:hypothetical protein